MVSPTQPDIRSYAASPFRFNTVCHGCPWFGGAAFRYRRAAPTAKNGSSSSSSCPNLLTAADALTEAAAAAAATAGLLLPTRAALGDPHGCFYGPPAADLSHLLACSTTWQFRKDFLHTVLKAYHCELEDVVQSQGT